MISEGPSCPLCTPEVFFYLESPSENLIFYRAHDGWHYSTNGKQAQRVAGISLKKTQWFPLYGLKTSVFIQ